MTGHHRVAGLAWFLLWAVILAAVGAAWVLLTTPCPP